jgi:hypothetical protein
MVLIARKGLRSGQSWPNPSRVRLGTPVLAPAPMSGHGAYHCAVAIFGSRTPPKRMDF